MSKTSSFSATNTGASAVMDIPNNYALVMDEPTQVVLSNKTCPIDSEEVISFMGTGIDKVNTNLNIQYPNPVRKGVQYVVKVESTLSTTDSVDASFRVDDPIIEYLTIRHPLSGNVTPAKLTDAFMRLTEACIDGSATAAQINAIRTAFAAVTFRWDSLMRLSLKPTR